MPGAPRVEAGTARRALRPGVEVLRDREFRPADAAENGLLVEVLARPHLRLVIGYGFVAGVARVVGVAARKPDRDDVRLAMVVRAPRLGPNAHASYVMTVNVYHWVEGGSLIIAD